MIKVKSVRNLLPLAMVMALPVHAASVTGTFAVLAPSGQPIAPMLTDVTGSIGGGTFSVSSTSSYFGTTWTAQNGTTFGPGTYNFPVSDPSAPPGLAYTGLVVNPGQVGAHILLDWNNNTNLDVILVWDVTTGTCLYGANAGSGTCTNYTSVDPALTNPANPDGIAGVGWLNGSTVGFSPNFNLSAPVPLPAAVWLFGSGLLGLVGFGSVGRAKQA